MPSASLINPVAELYLDGLYTYRLIQSEENPYMRWRYSRLATLAFYASLEAAINIQRPSSTGSLADKWKPEFDFSSRSGERLLWTDFIKMKSIRTAISHYVGSDKKGTKQMYYDLTEHIDAINKTTRQMLLKFYSKEVIDNWEKHIIPNYHPDTKAT